MKLLLATLFFFTASTHAENVYNDQGQIIGHTQTEHWYPWGTAPDGTPLFYEGGTLFSELGTSLGGWRGQVDNAGNGELYRFQMQTGGATTYHWDIINGRFVNPKTTVQRW